jgi:hypothetical protein
MRFAAGFFVAAALVSAPARACMGPTVLFSDDFQQPSDAWQTLRGDRLDISGGALAFTPNGGAFGVAIYTAQSMDSGDACVSITTPPVLIHPASSWAGIVFGLKPDSNDQASGYYALLVSPSGNAIMLESRAGHHSAKLAPMPAIKTGSDAVNMLRVTWNGASGQAYVNGQPFGQFDIAALKDTLFGFWAAGDASDVLTLGGTRARGATWKFGTLTITSVP